MKKKGIQIFRIYEQEQKKEIYQILCFNFTANVFEIKDYA